MQLNRVIYLTTQQDDIVMVYNQPFSSQHANLKLQFVLHLRYIIHFKNL